MVLALIHSLPDVSIYKSPLKPVTAVIDEQDDTTTTALAGSGANSQAQASTMAVIIFFIAAFSSSCMSPEVHRQNTNQYTKPERNDWPLTRPLADVIGQRARCAVAIIADAEAYNEATNPNQPDYGHGIETSAAAVTSAVI